MWDREARRSRLKRAIEEHPFWTDAQLAAALGVSVQTIRLDRLALGIPEQRARTEEVARRSLGLVRSLGRKELIGELLLFELGQRAESRLATTPDMAFARTGYVRGQPIYAQAESLAIALIDAPVALTGVARIKFLRPVRAGEVLRASAQVLRRKGNKFVVGVWTRAEGSEDEVFRGKFMVAALEDAEGPSGSPPTAAHWPATGDR